MLLLVWRLRPGVAAAAAVLVGAWMLTAQIAATVGFDHFADGLRSGLPAQLDWVDRQTGGEPVTFLGQAIVDPNGIQLTEFWNRSLRHVYALDSTAPGPGPTATPDVVRPDGTLDGMPDTRYVLAGNGVTLQGSLVEQEGAFTLYRRDGGSWKLHDAVEHLYSDGWAGRESAYTYFRPGQRGTLVVILSRTGFNGDVPPGVARVRVGTVRILPKGGGPALDRVYAPASHARAKRQRAEAGDPCRTHAGSRRAGHLADIPSERLRPAPARRAGLLRVRSGQGRVAARCSSAWRSHGASTTSSG